MNVCLLGSPRTGALFRLSTLRRAHALRRGLAALLLAAALPGGQAQLLTDPNRDWREADAPPPPALRTDGLVPFVVSVHSQLRFGVDPASVTLGPDGVIRYVIVAQSDSGTLNAWYEGLRCATAQVKTYAHWNPGPPGEWRMNANAAWRNLGGEFASRPAVALARGGFCDGATPNGRPADMLRALRQPKAFER
ncbi:CNP1-like family protein [Tepidimonas taiwanensis]|uniref:CNP1-like family protein n=1 Tax=Tepidimonas taiwanensis TaxID=307486 RepID=A0A554XCK4_9BURK|nr:CNP1-like family protein [Tepidimonas taiwanensis]MCX7693265.1 CNP1-like family protein [Tepidimonas taiwanensis]TSE33558.1 CNP1-like family protein [Tepidimonas taiwanensis]UBQ05741.1 CNP1-like family protein [Tepidimonas taiwanensis]